VAEWEGLYPRVRALRWNFTFEFGGATLAVDCLWRVMANGNVALTSRDHGQQFGRPAPMDACAAVGSLLQGRRLVEVRLDENSSHAGVRG
jgi:hypothetical protein